MAASSSSSEISLKLLVDKKSKKVLFGEANKDFVDFLIHILSLPVGTVLKLLKKYSMVGSLGKLYDSIENLSETYMQINQSKDSILNPKISNYGTHFPSLLLHDDDDDVPRSKKFYTCNNHTHPCVSDDPTAICSSCKTSMKVQMNYVAGGGGAAAAETAEGGGFVKGVVTYMVMDDLEVKPMSTISSITMLNKVNVKDISDLEEKVVSLGMKEGLMLLKTSFESRNVLTSVFLA